MNVGRHLEVRFSRSRVGQFLDRSQGATTVEQALFIALVIGAAMGLVEALGLVSEGAFATVARGIQAGDSAAAVDSGAMTSAETHSLGSPATASAISWVSPRLLILLVSCPFGAICWYLLYRDQRKRQAVSPVESTAMPAHVEEDAVFAKRHELLRTFSGDVGIFFTSRMQVRQVMTRHVETVAPSASLAEIRERMASKHIRHLLVCDTHGHLLGIVSDRDIHSPTARCARDVMTADPATVEPESLVNPAVTLLLQKRISCLPVVERSGRIVGVVTTTDLLMALQCTLHALQRAGAEAVADLPPETVPGFMVAALAQLERDEAAESLQAVSS